jgi:hypothetical protein
MLKKITGLAVALLISGNAYATHPLITDDTGTQGTGKFQIELNGELSNDRNSSFSQTSGRTAAMLSFGINDTIDLIIGLPYQWYTLKNSGITVADNNGIGDMSVEMKLQFLHSEDSGLSFALKPGVSMPTGSEDNGFGNGAVSGWLMLIATHEGRLGKVHCNLGYSHNEYGTEATRTISRNNIWHASAAGELNMTQSLRAVADIGIETNSDKTSDSHPAFLIGGVIYGVSKSMDLDIGLKRGLNNASTDNAFLGGVTARF